MSQSNPQSAAPSGAHRLLSVAVILLAMLFGAGVASLFPLLFPKPAPILMPAWRVLPMSQQTPVTVCKDGFAAAFRAAGFTTISTEPPAGFHVQATDSGYTAIGICMPRREAAAVVVTGIDGTVVDARLDAIVNRILPRQVPPPAPSPQRQ
jgi:hypothetical protein